MSEKKIIITLDLGDDTTSVQVSGMGGHGGIYRADSYRVRKYVDPVKTEQRWAGINDGEPEAQDTHKAFLAELALTYGPRVAHVVSQLMVADMAWDAESDERWGRAHHESW